MSDTRINVTSLIDSELARIGEPARRSRLQELLHRPARVSLAWDYGQADDRFDCWHVGQSPDGRLLLVYCKRGFGPDFPWGFVFADDGAMGMGSQWHSGLEDAAIAAGLLPAPAGYKVPGLRPSGGVG